MHLSAISNGLGSQSMAMLKLAAEGKILPATVNFTSDTGWENDCLLDDGRRVGAEEFFNENVIPICKDAGIEPKFVRSYDKDKVPLPRLFEHVKQMAKEGKLTSLKIPLFGSQGGRLRQSCTGKWKIRAINQAARRMGAETLMTGQGIHSGESARRVQGEWKGTEEGRWNIYQDTIVIKGFQKPIKWLTHYYPLVDLQMGREACREFCRKRKINFIVSSQCDGCPHKDLPRWERTDPGVLKDLADLETLFRGEFFFTDERVPLLEALEIKRRKRRENPDLFKQEIDFGCKNNICGT